ncbi:tripartite tricarboxylate transporter substrate binding protein [soil metagenome]
MPFTLRSWLVRSIAVLAATTCASVASAQSYPNHTVRLIVAQAPGSSADVVARIVANKLGEAWKPTVFIDNKPGANGIVGLDAVAKAAPDGYTWGLAVPSPMTINPFVYKSMPFKALEDLDEVTQLTTIHFSMVINPKLPVKTLADLIAYGKTRPDGLNYSSAGIGNLGHLAAELLAGQTGLKLSHIPNKGDTPALLDVIAGRTDFMFTPLPSSIAFVKSGQLTLLAVPAKKRLPAFPDVPTLIESGLADFVVEGWAGIVVPAHTPKPVVAEIQKAIKTALDDPAVKEAIEKQGFEVIGSSPEEFTALVKQDSIKWSGVVQRAGIKLND